MLRVPKVEQSTLATGFLTFQSCLEWCRFLANEADFNDTGDAEYWKAEADRFQSALDKGINGCSSHPKLKEAMRQYVEKLSTCTQQEVLV